MCEACEGRDQRGISPGLLRRARAVDAKRPGAKVSEQSWQIVAGKIEGAIVWADYERVLSCLDEAGQAMKRDFRCENAA